MKLATLITVSLKKYLFELEVLCRDHQFDILGLIETRVDRHTKDPEIQIDGYDIYRDDRNTSGGGVAVYVYKALRHFHRSDIKDPKLDIVGVESTPLHAKNIIVLSWYRPPMSDNDEGTMEALKNFLTKLDAEGKEIYLMGDTNCDFKKPNEGPARQLKSINKEFQLEQQMKEPTRVASVVNKDGSTRVTKTLIDHITTNRLNYILSVEVLKIGMTDHYLPLI